MKDFKKIISLALSAIMLASSLPMSALAAEETKAVKEDIDWENWLIPGADWSSYLDGASYYVDSNAEGGPTNGDNDYHWWCGGANPWTLVINDVGYGDGAGNISTKTWLANETTGATELGTIPTSDGVFWGFKGSKYFSGWVADTSFRADLPADRWKGVKDISAYEDTGYAVFTIDSVSGDAANAYLAIRVATDPWTIGLNGYEDLPVTKEKYENDLDWKEPYMSFVLGVKLSDYYNISKGGKQTVAVPISRLTGTPDFKEMYSKVSNTKPSVFKDKLANFPIDLRLFTGMGIAKKDSGKKQAFSAVVSDLAIVDPKTPTNLFIEQSGNDAIVIFDLTTDTDVTYKVKKTCNGVVEYIDAPEGVVEDVIDPEKSYMYQAVAVDNTFGVMSAPSEPAYIGAEGIDIEKDNIDWKNWVGEGELSWMNYLEAEVYYTGEVSIWNDYEGYTYRGGNNLVFNVDDSNAGTTMHINKQMLQNFGDMSSATDVPTIDGAWGYVGANYSKFRQMITPDNPSGKDKIPADKWLGVKDISAFKDGGYAVFTIESITGNGAEEAYLAITSATDIWQLGLDDTYTLPITKAEHENTNWVDGHFLTAVNGAKLTDYYDIEKGGRQTVAVPLAKLVDDPDFLEIKGKAYAGLANKITPENMQWYKTDLQLYSGMGIARRDAEIKKTFQATVSEMKIVALQLPENLEGTRGDDGSVTLTFATTNDNGVEFKIAKTVNGETEYFDAPYGTYTDYDIDPKAETTYKAVAYSAEYNIYAESEDSYVISPDYVSVVKDNMDWKNWVGEGEMSWMNYLENAVYYVGDLSNEWNDYGAVYRGGQDLLFTIDDSNAGTDMHINTQMREVQGQMEPLAEIPTNGGAWGYVGANYDKFQQMITPDNPSSKDKIPEDKWLGVKNIAPYRDNGYAVFTVESITGDGADDAYFAITSVPNPWKIPGLSEIEVNLPITKEETKDVAWAQEHYVTYVTGAKLTDYYDIEKGGKQTVAIPLTALTDAPEFFEIRTKDYNTLATWEDELAVDLQLFSGMGIARRDTASGKTFQATVSEMKIVAVEAPIDFNAVLNEDGTVTATFETTFDKDVDFKVRRVCDDGEVVYFDAPNGTYTDTTYNPENTYIYSAVAVYEPLSIETESENCVTFESDVVKYVKLYANGVETRYVKEGTMTAKFFTSESDATGYIARYDETGRLQGASLVPVTAGVEASASIDNVALTDTVKVMLWADGKAVVPAIVAEEKPVTILAIGDEGVIDSTEYISIFFKDDVEFSQGWNWDKTIEDSVWDIDDYLSWNEWDYILIQEDMEAVIEGTAYTGFDTIAAAIKEQEPNAKVFVIDGWCYSPDAAPDSDSETMFLMASDVPSAVREKATVIETANAIYLGAFDKEFDVWAEDGKGLSDTGKYITSLLVYKTMTGDDISDVTYTPDSVDGAAVREFVAGL